MERVGSYPLRHGTKVDGRLLSELFTQLHFEVMHWLDCTAMVGVSFICSLWIFVLCFKRFNFNIFTFLLKCDGNFMYVIYL